MVRDGWTPTPRLKLRRSRRSTRKLRECALPSSPSTTRVALPEPEPVALPAATMMMMTSRTTSSNHPIIAAKYYQGEAGGAAVCADPPRVCTDPPRLELADDD